MVQKPTSTVIKKPACTDTHINGFLKAAGVDDLLQILKKVSSSFWKPFSMVTRSFGKLIWDCISGSMENLQKLDSVYKGAVEKIPLLVRRIQCINPKRSYKRTEELIKISRP